MRLQIQISSNSTGCIWSNAYCNAISEVFLLLTWRTFLVFFVCFFILTDLVTSNGELLIVWNIVRNSSLWSDVVFEKEVIFHELDFEISDLDRGATKVCFAFTIISLVRRPIELKFCTGLTFLHNVEIHQLWRLVLKNYQ